MFFRLLRGDYCLESDLITAKPKKVIGPNISFISEMYKVDDESGNVSSEWKYISRRNGKVTMSKIIYLFAVESLYSDDEQEIRRYLKYVLCLNNN